MATKQKQSVLSTVLAQHEKAILQDWIRLQVEEGALEGGQIQRAELQEQASQFLDAFRRALQAGNIDDIRGPEWEATRQMLGDLSRSRGLKGFTPSETAMFVFSLKQPLFDALARMRQGCRAFRRRGLGGDAVIDKLGLYTTEVYQKSREEVIARQQQEMLELSTPVVKLWDGILALPLIGTLDSARTQVVMESLLQRIVETGAEIAIIDITGVPTVDTLVAQHLHQDRRGRAADGRRLHHQRHPPADRADHRPPRRRPRQRRHQGDAGRRLRARAATHRPDRVVEPPAAAEQAGLSAWNASRS